MAGRRGMRMIVAILALGVFALSATQAPGRTKIDTSFASHQVDCGFAPPDCLYSGQIDASKDKCLPRRKVKIFRLLTGGERQLIDTDKTTPRGNYAGLGLSSQVSAYKVKVLSKRVGDDKCRGVSYTGV